MSMYDKNMSEEKKASLEFAEDQREEQWHHPSFSLGLFHGNVEWSLLHPFPTQSPQEKKIGDEYLAKVKDFLVKNLNPDEVDRTGIIPEVVYKGLGGLGAFAMKVPTKYGGMGLSQVNYNRVMAMVSSYCGSTAVLLSAHQSIGVPQPLKLFGTQAQKDKYFPRFAKGAVSAFALTEANAGSDPRNMTTTATPIDDGKHFLINGEKLWCTNGLVADVIVVMCVTPAKIVHGKERKQITAFILDMDTPGIEKIHRCSFLGLHGIQNGVIRFKDVKVPRENIILGEGEGLKLALTTLNTGRLTLPAASAGIARWCIYVAREWSKERVQWGTNIGNHEAVALKIGYISSYAFAMEAMTWLSSEFADDDKKDIRLEAAIAKYFCTHHSWKIIDEVLQIRGGQGYETSDSLKSRGMHPWPVERVLRDVRINLIIEGTSDIMHLFIAREALDPHLSKMKPVLMAKGIGQMIPAALKMALHYAIWLPKQFLPSLSGFGDLDSRLVKHMRYVRSASKRLARITFFNMMKYQKKMEAKQSVINRIVDIGVELFAISATCAYADSLIKNDKNKAKAVELADLYCLSARKYIENLFKENSSNLDKDNLRVAKSVLADEYLWMEEDIVK